MKKITLLLLMLLLISGCGKNKIKEEKNEKILSTGDLVCGYKEERINENVIYSSVHIFNYNDNGILNGASNIESVEFNGTLDSVKDNYKKALEDNIKSYKDIEGVTVEKNIEKNKYSFEVKLDNKKMSEEKKEEYLLNLDRITLFKIFTGDGYSCE